MVRVIVAARAKSAFHRIKPQPVPLWAFLCPHSTVTCGGWCMNPDAYLTPAQVVEHEDVGASADAAYIDSPSGSSRALPHEYPPC